MPWQVTKSDKCPASKPWGVFKDDGTLEGCHETQDKAKRQQAALYVSEKENASTDEWETAMRTVVDES